MTVYQSPSGIWFYKFVYKGKQYHKSTGLKDKKKAEAIEIRIKNDLITGKYEFADDVGIQQFSIVCDEFEKFAEVNRKSWKKSEVYVFRYLKEYFVCFQLKDFTTFELEKYRLNLVNNGIKPATINRHLDVLSAIMRYSISNGYLNENPVLKIKKMKAKNNVERYLTEEETVRLFEKLPDYLKPLIIMLLHTACRKSEILQLKWSSVDFKNCVITLYETKNDKIKKLYMSDTVYNILDNLYKNRINGQEYVFINPNTGRPFKDFHRGFKNACKNAGFTVNTRIHDIRHTSATTMVASGIDLVTVASILGHSDIRVTASRYAHATPENKKRAVAALNSFGSYGLATAN